ncbi:peptidase C65 Otubain-domain-containing protein [Dunaliella salina]|uniref:Peptidase C65 Otubain-domain-containing protein n=1 Tax=Dunaliella salina TaxID=3046 RepID=A0ABQ7H0M6_DUNSA|nr:peptidase C65 Otubain-domain-containing protein [Dunaliella salina]|eukprot:KAF5840411.1 peptidase C65 Otubain-domain-containing protein [Dunaliella salina]
MQGNEVFMKKIQNLEHTYSHIRRTRGDGNCFFRAFIFSYLENLLNTLDKAECSRILTCVQSWRKKLIDVGFQELVFEDAMELLLQQVNGILHGNIGQEALEGAFQDDMISNTLVFLMRLITSAEVQRREDHFLPFILGMYDEPPASVSAFTQRYVVS